MRNRTLRRLRSNAAAAASLLVLVAVGFILAAALGLLLADW